jgi:hypothetical protein
MSNSILNVLKIQPPVVIPIVCELKKEIEKEREDAIIGRAIASAYVDYRELKGFEENSHPRVEQEIDNGFPFKREVMDGTEEKYGYNITGSEFAECFRSIGEPQIGILMTYGVYCAAEEFIRPEWDSERAQTEMKGDPHCDLRWRKGTSR